MELVLSMALFMFAISDTANMVGPSDMTSVYADDITVFYKSSSLNKPDQLQEIINKISQKALENSFSISAAKTQHVYFTHKHGIHPSPTL